MVTISKLNGDKICYEVDAVDDFNEFLYWLMYKVEDEECGISYNGYLFHFTTAIERQQFALGFRVAWEILDDQYFEKTHGRSGCHSDCVVNGLNPVRSVTERSFMKT